MTAWRKREQHGGLPLGLFLSPTERCHSIAAPSPAFSQFLIGTVKSGYNREYSRTHMPHGFSGGCAADAHEFLTPHFSALGGIGQPASQISTTTARISAIASAVRAPVRSRCFISVRRVECVSCCSEYWRHRWRRPILPKNSRANLEQLFGRCGPTSRRSIFRSASAAPSERHSSTSTANASLRRGPSSSFSAKCWIEKLLQGGAVVARQPHKLEAAGSSPAPATSFALTRSLAENGMVATPREFGGACSELSSAAVRVSLR